MPRLASAMLVLCTTLAALTPVTARADWNVGSDIGLSFFAPEDGAGLTTFGWGGTSALLIPTFQPGLRFGVTLGAPQSELVVTSSLVVLSGSGETFRVLQGMLAYQHSFSIENRTRPFVNVGIGVNHLGDEDDSISAPVFGIGLGTRQMMGHGHGAVRVEARLDHQNEFEEGGNTVFPSANAFAVRVGWELWN